LEKPSDLSLGFYQHYRLVIKLIANAIDTTPTALLIL